MTDLITRLEQAEAGSRELDLEIWGNHVAVPRSPRPWKLNVTPPAYTSSLDAITALIGEKLPGKQTGMLYKAMSHLNERHALHCRFWKAEIDGSFTEKLALALCAALLQAIKEGEHG